MDLNRLFFKYLVYYPVVIARGEWIYPHLRRLRESQYWGPEQLQRHQLERINRLLSHAKATTKAYKDYPDRLNSLDELKQLPFIEKEDIRDRFADFLSSKQSLLHRDKTSGGSTGAPVTVRKDHRAMAQELAATWRGYEWAGVGIGDRQARFWGVPHSDRERLRARLIDLVTNRRRISAFNFGESEMAEFAGVLQEFRPSHFYGYVSMLREFAQFLQRSSISIPGLKAVITTSEVLTEPDRALFHSAFNTKVFNEYGCGEVGTIAHECEYGGLHINAENMILEAIDGQGRVANPEGIGEFVVTELNNLTMPLIRYRMRDYGAISGTGCKCGRQLPSLTEVGGRAYDILESRSGRKFHGEFFLYIVEDLKKTGCGINGYQIIQRTKDQLDVALVPGKGYQSNRAKDFILDRLLSEFDENVMVTINEVSQISREPSGKLRVVKRQHESESI